MYLFICSIWHEQSILDGFTELYTFCLCHAFRLNLIYYADGPPVELICWKQVRIVYGSFQPYCW